DDDASLRKTIYNWYFWAYVVKRTHGRRPATLAVGTLRRLFWDSAQDVWLDRNFQLAGLTVEMSVIKLRALLAAGIKGNS
ncbi:MAG: hypothetical protein WDZ49_03400, partial [Litorilinea sp.]